MKSARLITDTSALGRALIDGSEVAIDALSRASALLAPDLVYAEFANALAVHVRVGRMPRSEAVAVLDDVRLLPLEITPTGDLMPAALVLALELGLSAYDGCFVALAEAEQALLVTADRRLAAAYERSELVS